VKRLAAVVCFAACGCSRPVDDGGRPAVEAFDAVASAQRPGPASGPLKVWMAANLSRAVKTQDFEALAQALPVLAASAPPELEGWAAIAARGAEAAAARDIERVRQSCGDCHDSYRAAYRARFRARPFPLPEMQQRGRR
jgi:hypothetical protein